MVCFKKRSSHKLSFRIMVLFGVLILALSMSGCAQFGKMLAQPLIMLQLYVDYKTEGAEEFGVSFDEFAEGVKRELKSDSDIVIGSDNIFGDDSAGAPQSSGSGPAGSTGTDGDSGPLKPVGFVNYGEYDATVRAYSYKKIREKKTL